jgi:hypothetical protein
MRSAGFERVEMQAHSFATASFDADTYGAAAVPLIRSFVPGRNGVSKDEANAWATEQLELGQHGEFYFACLQFCFTAIRLTEPVLRAPTNGSATATAGPQIPRS